MDSEQVSEKQKNPLRKKWRNELVIFERDYHNILTFPAP